MPREPTGLELVQPTENQGVSSPEDASVHHMVVVARTHHEDQGMVFRIITSDFSREMKDFDLKFRGSSVFFLLNKITNFLKLEF